MAWEEIRFFGDALAKPFGLTTSFFRTAVLILRHPKKIAGAMERDTTSRLSIKGTYKRTTDPAAFFLSAISLSFVLLGLLAGWVHVPSSGYQERLKFNIAFAAAGLIFTIVVNRGKSEKSRALTLAAFCYVAGLVTLIQITADFVVIVYSLLLHLSMDWKSDLPLGGGVCYQTQAELLRQATGQPTFGLCGWVQFFRGLVVIGEFIYIMIMVTALQRSSRIKTFFALVLAHLVLQTLVIIMRVAVPKVL